MNRAELQQMAVQRILDARILCDSKSYQYAYYTAGYAIECGLKSAILARMIYTGLIFREKWKPEDVRIHKLSNLVDQAGLRDELNSASANVQGFNKRWQIVEQWTVESRYQPRSEAEARGLIEAIEGADGVMEWIQKHW